MTLFVLGFLDALMSRFQWYRRARGGHWERWWIDSPVYSLMWLRREHGSGPPIGCGNPECTALGCQRWPHKCEDYATETPKRSAYRD